MSDLIVDGQGVGRKMISHHTDTSSSEHVVDVLHILRHLIVHLLQLSGIGLQLAIGIYVLCDITSYAEDTQQLVLLASDGQQLQFIIHLLTLQNPVEWSLVILCRVDLCHVHIVHILNREVLESQYVLHVDLHPSDGLISEPQRIERFLVQLRDIAVLIIGHHVDHGRVEDGLVAQHRILHLLMTGEVFGDVITRTDDDRRLMQFVTPKD